MDIQQQNKMTSLRRSLDALHFSQPLSLESVPLVDKLLRDLSKVTEGFSTLKKENAQLIKKVEEATQLQTPLKLENQRLVKENNALHQELIRLKDVHAAQLRDRDTSHSQLVNSNVDLEFVAKQRANRVQELEREVIGLKDKLEALMGKAPKGQPGFKSSGPINAEAVFKGKKQGMNMTGAQLPGAPDALLSRQDLRTFVSSVSEKEKKAWADSLRDADQRAHHFQLEVQKMESKMRMMEGEMVGMKDSLALRDQEIERLGRLFKGGENLDMLKKKYEGVEYERQMKTLMAQNDHLNKENHRLNSQVNGKAVQDKAIGYELQRQNKQLIQRVKEMESRLTLTQNTTYEHKKLVDLEILNKEREELKKLQTENGKLNEQVKSLLKWQECAERVEAAYNSDKQAFQEAITRIKAELDQKREALKRLEEELEQTQMKLIAAEKEIGILSAQSQNIEQSKKMQQTSVERLQQEVGERDTMVSTLRRKVSSLEEELLNTKGEKESVKRELDRTVKERGMISEEASGIKLEKLDKERQAENATIELQRLKTRLECTEQELVQAKQEQRTLEGMLERKKREVGDVDGRASSLFVSLQTLQEQNALLKEEVANVSQSLTGKNEEFLRVESEKLRLERELNDLKGARSQLQLLENNRKEELATSLRKENELSRLRQAVNQKEAELIRKQDRLIEADEQIRILQDERDRLISELRKLDYTSEQIESYAKRQVSADAEAAQRQAQIIQGLRADKMQLRTQLDSKVAALAKQTVEIESLESKVRTTEALLKQREYELSAVRDQLAGLQHRVDNEHSATSGLTSLQKQTQLELEAVHRKFEGALHQKETIAAENAKLAGLLASEQKKSGMQSEQIDQLKKLLNGLDSAKQDLLKRLESTMSERQMSSNEKQGLFQQIEGLKGEIAAKVKEVQTLHSQLLKLDARMDSMQNELDLKTEQLETARGKLAEQDATLRDLNSHVAVASDAEQKYGKRLQEREDQILNLQNKVNMLGSQVEESRQIAQFKAKELAQLQEEVIAITRENGAVTTELTRTVQSRDYFKSQCQESQSKERQVHQGIRALELEKKDVLGQLKEVCSHNERLEENLRAITAENRDLYSKIQTLDHQRAALHGQLVKTDDMESHYINEIKTLEKHIEGLTRDQQRLKEDLRHSLQTKEALFQDAHHAKQLHATAQSNREDLQRYIADLEHEKLQLMEESKEGQMSSDLLKNQLEYEKSRYTELENVLQEERRIQHQKDVKLRTVDVELAEYRSELNRKELRLTTLQNHLQALQRQASNDKERQQLVTLIKEQENKVDGMQQELKAKSGSVRELCEENERLKGYLSTYEKKVKELERSRA